MTIMVHGFALARLSITCALVLSATGCGQSAEAPDPAPPPVGLASHASPAVSTWVASDDGLLALRISVVPRRALPADGIDVAAELRNLGSAPTTVLRPFGDWYAAEADGMKIRDGKQRVGYSGPTVCYTLGAGAFAEIAPGESIEDRMFLRIENFPGMKPPGSYTFRYDYSYDGNWDATLAADNGNVRSAWRGAIRSPVITVTRQ